MQDFRFFGRAKSGAVSLHFSRRQNIENSRKRFFSRFYHTQQSGDERIAVERRAREVAEERLKRVLQEAEVG